MSFNGKNEVRQSAKITFSMLSATKIRLISDDDVPSLSFQ